jgi:hypothetical protein
VSSASRLSSCEKGRRVYKDVSDQTTGHMHVILRKLGCRVSSVATRSSSPTCDPARLFLVERKTYSRGQEDVASCGARVCVSLSCWLRGLIHYHVGWRW